MFVEYFMQSRAADCPRVVGVFVCESLEVKQSELHLTNYVPLKQREINQVAYKLKSKSIFLTSELLENKPIPNIIFSSEQY